MLNIPISSNTTYNLSYYYTDPIELKFLNQNKFRIKSFVILDVAQEYSGKIYVFVGDKKHDDLLLEPDHTFSIGTNLSSNGPMIHDESSDDIAAIEDISHIIVKLTYLKSSLSRPDSERYQKSLNLKVESK